MASAQSVHKYLFGSNVSQEWLRVPGQSLERGDQMGAIRGLWETYPATTCREIGGGVKTKLFKSIMVKSLYEQPTNQSTKPNKQTNKQKQ